MHNSKGTSNCKIAPLYQGVLKYAPKLNLINWQTAQTWWLTSHKIFVLGKVNLLDILEVYHYWNIFVNLRFEVVVTLFWDPVYTIYMSTATLTPNSSQKINFLTFPTAAARQGDEVSQGGGWCPTVPAVSRATSMGLVMSGDWTLELSTKFRGSFHNFCRRRKISVFRSKILC